MFGLHSGVTFNFSHNAYELESLKMARCRRQLPHPEYGSEAYKTMPCKAI